MKLRGDSRVLAQRYADDGVVVVGRILDDAQVSAVRGEVDRYVATVLPRMSEEVRRKAVRYEPDGTTIRVLYDLHKHDPYFVTFAMQESFTTLVRSITGWRPELVLVETRHKPAAVGTRVAMHQESWYRPKDPVPRAILWMALDPVTVDNGPVRFWLGTHRYGVFEHVSNPPSFKVGDEAHVESLAEGVLVGVFGRGWATLHDGYTAHDSPANTTPAPRLAIAAEYRRADG